MWGPSGWNADVIAPRSPGDVGQGDPGGLLAAAGAG
jgi:hypothetical protein